MKKPKNLQDLIQALYQSNKTGSATYWIDSPEETVQESLVDEELVIVYRGRGEESEKVYQGDLDSYKYKRAIDRDKRQKDLFRDMMNKNTITIVHRNFKKRVPLDNRTLVFYNVTHEFKSRKHHLAVRGELVHRLFCLFGYRRRLRVGRGV